MAVTPIVLTNPGGEPGTTAGWTARIASFAVATSAPAAHAGTYRFEPTGIGTVPPEGVYHYHKYDQQIDVSAYATAIDNGVAGVKGAAWNISNTFGGNPAWEGALYVEAYAADGVTLLFSNYSSYNATAAWAQKFVEMGLLPGTRYVRIGAIHRNDNMFGATQNYFDDFTLEISDDVLADYGWARNPRALQLGVYALGARDAEEVLLQQLSPLALVAAETSNGTYDVYAHQLGAYALARRYRVNMLRAWTIPQDDHDFWFLQLGGDHGTLIWDRSTKQFSMWRSPEYPFFRGSDGLAWEGWNVCCDPLTGKIFKIDPENRLDYGETPVESITIGMVPARLREVLPCYAVELTVSDAEPAADGTGIQVRISDDGGRTFFNLGALVGEAYGDSTLFRWYSAGQIAAPGRIFEITDTGYARRIDSLEVDLGQ